MHNFLADGMARCVSRLAGWPAGQLAGRFPLAIRFTLSLQMHACVSADVLR